MVAYRLRPSRERLLRAARAILTERDELAERQLGAIYRHVKLDAQLPRMVTEEELRGFGEPVALFASEQDPFFPGEAVVARAQAMVPNLVAAECLRYSRHIPTKAALGHVNEEILAFLEGHDGRLFTGRREPIGLFWDDVAAGPIWRRRVESTIMLDE